MRTIDATRLEKHRLKYDDVCETVRVAVNILATGIGSIQNRLAFSMLKLDVHRVEDFPIEARAKYQGIMDDLRCRYVDSPDGRSWCDIPDEDGAKLANRIVDFFEDFDSLSHVVRKLS
jgi:hypothetical protein